MDRKKTETIGVFIAKELFYLAIFIVIGILSTSLLCSAALMKQDYQSIVYASMVQGIVAWMAFLAAFVIFKIQIQIQRIAKDYEMAKLEFHNSNIYPSLEYLDECMEKTLSDVNKNSAKFNFIKEIRDRINKNKAILNYVRKNGITVLCLYGFIFMFYFFAIHLDYTIWKSNRWLIAILPIGFWLSIYMICRTVDYLIKCLRRDT